MTSNLYADETAQYSAVQKQLAVDWLPRLLRRVVFAAPIIFLLVVCANMYAENVQANQGRLHYAIDDAYIHMALAQNIVRGHYGINMNEPSAPSSSILWPFLLAPFMLLPFREYIPFILGMTFAILSLITVMQLIALVSPGVSRVRRALFAIAFIYVTNMIGVMFSGMEHVMQIFCAALLIYAIANHRHRGNSSLLVFAIVLGPLVRYENISLSLIALLYLLFNGHFKLLIISGVLLAVFVGGFSLFLIGQGLPPIPSSITVKSGFFSDPNKMALFNWLLNGALTKSVPGRVLTLLIGGAIAYGCVAHEKREVAFGLAIAGLLHIAVGMWGHFNRYELYIWATMFCGYLYLFSDVLNIAVPRANLIGFAAAGAVLVHILAYPYTRELPAVWRATHGDYLQQYQMHRFLTEYYRQPVAVNDLGWVAFDSDYYILDLWGLGSAEAQRIRFENGPDFHWVDDLMAEHDVKLAMVYPGWFNMQISDMLIPLGSLVVLWDINQLGSPEVVFYAADEETAHNVRIQLAYFRSTLPDGVVLYMLPAPRAQLRINPSELP